MKRHIKKIGLFGGTFDPFHLGHSSLIRALAEGVSELEKILVIPFECYDIVVLTYNKINQEFENEYNLNF